MLWGDDVVFSLRQARPRLLQSLPPLSITFLYIGVANQKQFSGAPSRTMTPTWFFSESNVW